MIGDTDYSLAIDTRNLESMELTQLQAAIAEAKQDHKVIVGKGVIPVESGRAITEDAGITFLIITGTVVGIGVILRALPLGQMIDLRTDPPQTRVKWGLNSKLILVIGTDGEVEIKTNKTSDVLDDALKLVLEISKESITTVKKIAQAIQNALKDKVKVIPTRSDLEAP